MQNINSVVADLLLRRYLECLAFNDQLILMLNQNLIKTQMLMRLQAQQQLDLARS